MAEYLGDYYWDIEDKVTVFTLLSSYLVTGATLNTSRGIRENTDFDFDSQYLPAVYWNNVTRKPEKLKRFCPVPIRKRYAKLYLCATSYLHVDLPFKPGTSEYDQFFIEAAFNFDILSVGIEGEFIQCPERRLDRPT